MSLIVLLKSDYTMEFLDSVISEKWKEVRAFEGVKRELTNKEGTIKRQDKFIEHLFKSVEKLSLDKVINRFIDENISYDFKYPNGLDLTDIYKEYCSWWNHFYCQDGGVEDSSPPKSMVYIKDYLDYRFKPSLCGRVEPFYVVYFGTTFKSIKNGL